MTKQKDNKTEVFVVEDHEGVRHYSSGVRRIFKTKRKANAYLKKYNGRWDGCEGCLNLQIRKMVVE